MAARLKRRSSTFSHQSTPAPKGSSGNAANDLSLAGSEVQTPVAMVEQAQEEAERRGRARIQKRQSLGHIAAANAAAALAQTPQGSGPNEGGTPLPPGSAVRGYSAAQLSEHYSNCMKLSAENKINAKNAFHLQLIDYMTEMMRKKQSDMDNFQVASVALDASAKIYAYRVDSVHNDTLKLAGGVGKGNEQEANAGGEDGGVEDGDLGEGGQVKAKDKQRKKKAAATIEKNLNNINCNKFDLEFDVDPLFKKTSAQFDSGGGTGGQFLYNLYIRDDGCEFLLDSGATLGPYHALPSQQQSQNPDNWEVPELLRNDDKKLVDPAVAICPTFSNFSFRGWSVDDEDDHEPTADDKKDDKTKLDEHAFDADAAPILAADDYNDNDGFGGGGGGDSFLGDDNLDNVFEDEVREGQQRGRGGGEMIRDRGVSLALMDNLREHLLAAPSEYSYFDQGRLGAWAGPRHWKFKPMRSSQHPGAAGGKGGPEENNKGRKKSVKAVAEDYDFEEMFAGEMSVLMEAVEKTMTIPKRAVQLQKKTMEKWGEDKLGLPRDLAYRGKDFSKSFVTDFHITGKPVGPQSQNMDDTVQDYDFNNPNDTAEFCPSAGVDGDDGGVDGDGGNDYPADDPMMGGDTIFPTQTQGGEEGLTMVAAPNRVEKIQIGYAKQAKKMDMRRLKTIEWKILQEACAASGGDKENQVVNGVTFADQMEDKMDAPLNFKDLYQTLHEPNRMPPKMTENLSVPLAFVALLHLCNEKSLALECVPDFSDFIIKQG